MTRPEYYNLFDSEPVHILSKEELASYQSQGSVLPSNIRESLLEPLSDEAADIFRLSNMLHLHPRLVENFYPWINDQEKWLREKVDKDKDYDMNVKIALVDYIKRMDRFDWYKALPAGTTAQINIFLHNSEVKWAFENWRDGYDKWFNEQFPPTGQEPRPSPEQEKELISIQKEKDRQLILNEIYKLERERINTWGATIFKHGYVMPAWMAEMALTRTPASLGRKGAQNILLKASKNLAATRGGRITLRAAGWTAAAIARGTALAPRIGVRYSERRLPRRIYLGPNDNIVFDVDQEEPYISLIKSWGSMIIEAGSETAGGAISRGFNKAAKGTGRFILGKSLLPHIREQWMKLAPENTFALFAKKLGSTVEWNGMIGELGEERLASILHRIFDTEDMGAGPDADIFDRLVTGIDRELWQMFTIEAPLFAIPGGVNILMRSPQLKSPIEKPNEVGFLLILHGNNQNPSAKKPWTKTELQNLASLIGEKIPEEDWEFEAYKNVIIDKSWEYLKERLNIISEIPVRKKEVKIEEPEIEKPEKAPKIEAAKIEVEKQPEEQPLETMTLGELEELFIERFDRKNLGKFRKGLVAKFGEFPSLEKTRIEIIKSIEREAIEESFLDTLPDITYLEGLEETVNILKEKMDLPRTEKNMIKAVLHKQSKATDTRGSKGISNQTGKHIIHLRIWPGRTQRGAVETIIHELYHIKYPPKMKLPVGFEIERIEELFEGEWETLFRVVREGDKIPITRNHLVSGHALEEAYYRDNLFRCRVKRKQYHYPTLLEFRKNVHKKMLELEEISVETQLKDRTNIDAAEDAKDSSNRYLGVQDKIDLSPEEVEPNQEQIAFMKEVLHKLGLKSKDGYIPLSEKDINDLLKFIDMPSDIAFSFPNFRLLYEIFRQREVKATTFNHYFWEKIIPYFDLKAKNRVKINKALIWIEQHPTKIYSRIKGETFLNKKRTAKNLKQFDLSEKETEGFFIIREALDEAANLLAAEMENSGMNEEFIEGFKKQILGYVPHKWYGKWIIIVRDDKGKTVWKSQVEHKNQAFDERLKLQKIYPEYKDTIDIFEAKKIPATIFQEIPSYAVSRMIEKIITKSGLSPEIVSILQDTRRETYKSVGFSSAFQKRKNVPGWSTDLEHPLAEYFTGLSAFLARIDAIPKVNEAFNEFSPSRQPVLYEYSKNYIKYNLGSQTEFRRIKQSMYVWYLYLNISAAVLNLSQNFVLGWPVIANYMGEQTGWKRSSLALLLQAMARRTFGDKLLTEKEKETLEELRKEGFCEPKLAQEVSLYAGNPLMIPFQRKIAKLANLLDVFKHIEIHNRESMAIALIDAGETGIYKIGKAIDEAHFRYGKGNRPILARGYISPVMVFRSWGLNYIWWVKQQSIQHNWSALTRSAFALFLFGGLGAFPFIKPLKELWKKLFKKDPEAEIAEIFGTLASRVIFNGPPAMGGTDYGISFSQRILPFSVPTTRDYKNWKDALVDIGGVFMDIPNRAGLVAEDIKNKDYMRAIEDAAPQAIRNLFAARRLQTMGARTRSGRPIVDWLTGQTPLKLNQGETVAKMLGFQPYRMAKGWDIQSTLAGWQEELVRKKQHWANRIILAAVVGDREGMIDIFKEVEAHNKKMRERDLEAFTIKYEDLDRMLKIRAKPINIPPQYMWPIFYDLLRKYRGIEKSELFPANISPEVLPPPKYFKPLSEVPEKYKVVK